MGNKTEMVWVELPKTDHHLPNLDPIVSSTECITPPSHMSLHRLKDEQTRHCFDGVSEMMLCLEWSGADGEMRWAVRRRGEKKELPSSEPEGKWGMVGSVIFW